MVNRKTGYIELDATTHFDQMVGELFIGMLGELFIAQW